MPSYANINGTQREISAFPVMIGGVQRELSSAVAGIGGVQREIFSSGIPFDPVFANNDWATIIAVCQAKAVPDSWAVGNEKEMLVGGTNHRIRIIGKNHDDYSDGSGKAPLTFEFANLYEESLNQSFKMNTSQTNSGGWNNSNMRKTKMTTVLNAMPSEVKSGVKQVNKLTSSGNKSTSIVTSSDKLFLLSEAEYWGTNTKTAAGEGSRYAYYAQGGSFTRSSPSGGGMSRWWTRSPAVSDTKKFVLVYNAGPMSSAATETLYVAPAFCF